MRFPGTRRQVPLKRTINLAAVGKRTVRPVPALLAMVCAVCFIGLLSKYMVKDRFDALARARAEGEQLREQIAETKSAIAHFEGLDEAYAHYTYEGMTEAELALPDYAAVMEMIREAAPGVSAWSIEGNQLYLELGTDTLASIDRVVQALEAHPMTEHCSVTTVSYTATSDRDIRAEESVSASVIVALRSARAMREAEP